MRNFNGQTISMREQLAGILERLELQSIPGWIKEKKRRLLPNLPRKADARGDDELLAGSGEPIGQAVPVLPRQHDAEMRDRNIMAVHRIRRLHMRPPRSIQVRQQLMAE